MDSCSSCSSTEIAFQFPDLVLLEIFKHVDIKSLGVCKKVCKSWRNLIRSIEQKPTFHFHKCRKEIQSSVLTDILDKMFPDHWQNQGSVIWKEIFVCWDQWSNLYGSKYSVKLLLSDLNGISCMQVSGDWLVISTCQRMGKLIGVRLSDGKTIDLYAGGNAIVGFELVNDNIDDAKRPSYNAEREQFFNTLSHNAIWVELKYCYARVGRHCVAKRNNVNETIRHSHGYRLDVSNSTLRQVLHLQKATGGPLVLEHEMHVSYKGSVNFWADKISFHSINDLEGTINVLNINMKSQDITIVETHLYRLSPSQYSSSYSWQNSLFFIHSDAPMLIVLNGEKSTVFETPYKKGYISSILFYCNHLLMGTNRGLLMIYKVDKPENCSNVYPFITESYNIQVTSEKIIKIAVAEPVHHKGKGPMIICGTSGSVYAVTFPDIGTK